MVKRITSFLFIIFSFYTASAQLESANVKIIDDLKKEPISNHDRRSIETPTPCVIDTIEYARYNQSGSFLGVVTGSEGRGLAQFYGAPQPLTIYGATFYAYISNRVGQTSNVYVNLYEADSDSLPMGAPLRSDTITVDSSFGGGVISNLIRHANFDPITIDFDYIIAVETDPDDTLSIGIVTNDWNNNSGKGRSFNAGSINDVWYRGRNLNIGGNSFDADILINPHVKYDLVADFEIVDQCYKTGNTVNFKNQNKNNVSSSIFYNRWAYSNQEMYTYRWNYDVEGSPYSSYLTIDGQTVYYTSQPYTVRLASMVLQWTNSRYCYDTAIYTIYPKPDIPNINGDNIACDGEVIDLTTNAPLNTIVRWASDNIDTTGFYTGDSLTSSALTENTDFFARVSNGVCLSDAGSFAVSVYPYPDEPLVKNDSICIGSKATLTAFSAGSLSINWFRDSSDLYPIHNGVIFQTKNLSTDTFFFVRASNYKCVSDGFVKVSAVVSQDFAPQEPDYYGDTIVCSSTSPIITLNASVSTSDVIRWFDQNSGSTPVQTGNTYTFPAPKDRGVYNYFVESYNGSCASSRVIARVEVDKAPDITNVRNDEICIGNSAYIEAKIPYGDLSWYTSSVGGTAVSHDSRIDFFKMISDTMLYVEASSGICVSGNRVPVFVMVNTPPEFTEITNDTICSKSFATLVANAPYGDVLWYEEFEDTIPFAIGKTFKTPTLIGNKTYYIATQYKGCISPKDKVSALVNPRPFSGFFYDVMKDYNVKFTPLTTAGVSYNWNFGDGDNSNAVSPTHQYPDTGYYSVNLVLTANASQCKDTTYDNIYIPWVDRTSVYEINGNKFKIYPNPSANLLTIENNDLNKESRVYIMGLDGKIVFEQEVRFTPNTNIVINHNLQTGIYILRFENQVWKIAVRN